MKLLIPNLKQWFKQSRFVRGEAVASGPVVLNHRRVFILPTRRGLLFVMLIALLLLIAFIYNNNLAYMLVFLLASLFFVSILHSFKALAGLVVQAGRVQEAVFAGQSGGFNFLISNPGQQARLALELQLESSLSLVLAANQMQSVTLYAPTSRRGWQTAGALTIASHYPLGLFRAWSSLRFDNALLVYPQPAALSRPFPESDAGPESLGQSRHQGDEFYGLRSYQPGDAIRQIHWKAYAKGQGIYSKQYSGADGGDLWLDYQQTPGHHLEERLGQLCRWIIDAEQAGLRYGLILPGARLEVDAGAAHYQRCLQTLALY